MPKKKLINLLFYLTLAFAVVPAFYFYNRIQEFRTIKKLQGTIQRVKHAGASSEYFQFDGLKFEGEKTVGVNNYEIRAEVHKTQGNANIERLDGEIALEGVVFEGLMAKVNNKKNGGKYDVYSRYVEVNSLLEQIYLFDGFKILAQTKENTDFEGENVLFDFKKKEISSLEKVRFWNADSSLVANSFFCTERQCLMEGDVVYSMPNGTVSADNMKVDLIKNKKGSIFVSEIKFYGQAELFDTKTNAKAYADEIIFNQKENVAFLKGNAKIVDEKGVVEGESMFYDIQKAGGTIKGNAIKNVDDFVKVNFFY